MFFTKKNGNSLHNKFGAGFVKRFCSAFELPIQGATEQNRRKKQPMYVRTLSGLDCFDVRFRFFFTYKKSKEKKKNPPGTKIPPTQKYVTTKILI
jgi:hypothetical protein